MKTNYTFKPTFLTVMGALCLFSGTSLHAQVQIYSPTNWVNDPFTTNGNYSLARANTTSPIYYVNNGTSLGGVLGNSPIGATLTLAKPGDTVIFSGQVTLSGNVNAGNLQFRLGLYYRDAKTDDVGWLGYMVGNPTGNGSVGIYLRTSTNTSNYASMSGTI